MGRKVARERSPDRSRPVPEFPPNARDLPGHLVRIHLAARILRDYSHVWTQAVGDLDLTDGKDAIVCVRRGLPRQPWSSAHSLSPGPDRPDVALTIGAWTGASMCTAGGPCALFH